MQLSGAIPPMVTPTTDNTSDVDVEKLQSFTRFLVNGGVHALFPCGSLGEFSSLSRAQRSTVINTVVENSEGLPVLAGCGGTSVDGVRTLVSDAAKSGADAAVIVTPYYLNATEEGLVAFYKRLLENTPLPIILYDIPSLTGNQLPVEAVSELADQPEIIGIKDSTGNFSHHQELIESTPESFTVLQGLAEFAISSLDIGADGFVAGPANVYPKPLSQTYEAYKSGDRDQAIGFWQNVSNPIVAATKSLPTATGLKYLLRRRGQDVGDPLPPLSPPLKHQQKRLDECHDRVLRQFQNVESMLD